MSQYLYNHKEYKIANSELLLNMAQSTRVILVVFFILFSSCSGDTFFQRESYNLPEKPTHKLEKVFEVEEAGEGNFFYMIKDIHFLNNGNLVIQNYPDQKLYELSPEGGVINVIGRKGRGPGEFMDVYETELVNNDTLHVIDFNHSRHQVMKKTNIGKWIAAREPDFKRVLSEDMTEQVPEATFQVKENQFMGVFKISPGTSAIDTLTRGYTYTAKVDHNLKQITRTTRLRPTQVFAINRTGNSMAIGANARFFFAHYLYDSTQDVVLYIKNTSNEIVGIDSLGNESVNGLLPYEHFPPNKKAVSRYLDRTTSTGYYDTNQEIKKKLLDHEPIYRNIALYKNQLWVHLAREDTTKPNWVVTALSGEVLKSFFGPNNISGIEINNDRMYGVERSSDGGVSVVSYTLTESQ